jgi:hypothetical protein
MEQGWAASLSSYTTGSRKPSFIFVYRNRDPVPAGSEPRASEDVAACVTATPHSVPDYDHSMNI